MIGIAFAGLRRAVGRTRDIDPAHRRDGLGIVLLVLAVVVAAGVWWGAGGPVGAVVDTGLTSVIGVGALPLPLLLLGVGVYLMCTPTRPEVRPRMALGGLLLVFGALGLTHVLLGAPLNMIGWREAGGALGYLAGAPLAAGLTGWVAAPVLGLVALYGLLVLTGTPVRQVPARVRRLFGGAPESAPEPEGADSAGADQPGASDEKPQD
ncbi:MAG: cell division protein FtsK, partial [Pseudonocardia sp.]|nr:cell division protein FtsK [Pseudonocardia sp.]